MLTLARGHGLHLRPYQSKTWICIFFQGLLYVIIATLSPQTEMPTILEEASSVVPPVTTAQEVREASASPQEMRCSTQVCMVRLPSCKGLRRQLSIPAPSGLHLGLGSDGGSLLASYHRHIVSRLMQIAQQEEESRADDEGLQMVLRRLKALEQENDGPERRELLRRRKKQLKEVLSQHKDGSQLPALQKRFEQEVQWASSPLCSGFTD